MSGIKYYILSDEEDCPDEFCAIRNDGGEPADYYWYVPEKECDKLRELVRDLYLIHFEDYVPSWSASHAAYERHSPCELCSQRHGGRYPCASTSKDMSDECCNPIQAEVIAERMRELGVEVDE